MESGETQTTIDGSELPKPPCEYCGGDAVRVLFLRGFSKERIYACADCDIDLGKGPGGVERERPLKPRDCVEFDQSEGESAE